VAPKEPCSLKNVKSMVAAKKWFCWQVNGKNFNHNNQMNLEPPRWLFWIRSNLFASVSSKAGFGASLYFLCTGIADISPYHR